MDELIQHGKNTLWKVLFRKNSYADLYRKDNLTVARKYQLQK